MYYGNIKTVTSTTGRGRHLYFKYPKTIVNINRTYPGIDIQGEGAYVLLPLLSILVVKNMDGLIGILLTNYLSLIFQIINFSLI